MVESFISVQMTHVETAENRLSVYNKQTEPLIAFYQEKGLVKQINGDQPIDKVFQDILSVLV